MVHVRVRWPMVRKIQHARSRWRRARVNSMCNVTIVMSYLDAMKWNIVTVQEPSCRFPALWPGPPYWSDTKLDSKQRISPLACYPRSKSGITCRYEIRWTSVELALLYPVIKTNKLYLN
ncbi:hypothetical protein EVAR_18519_1 [Eumeta japonica]|uniref:Uncharacterized protein n=1 Tax=Eumeta variegata TaxID=151549 RepID=A0A4C1V0G2_EUMVA|nr:hypothetical protein EVAR_18519_1 [Eumeta japonica]